MHLMGHELWSGQYLDYIGAALGKQPQITVKPTRKGEVTRYVANIGRARAILGYHPQTSLAAGIPKAVAWCLDGWEKIK